MLFQVWTLSYQHCFIIFGAQNVEQCIINITKLRIMCVCKRWHKVSGNIQDKIVKCHFSDTNPFKCNQCSGKSRRTERSAVLNAAQRSRWTRTDEWPTSAAKRKPFITLSSTVALLWWAKKKTKKKKTETSQLCNGLHSAGKIKCMLATSCEGVQQTVP